MLNHIWAFLVVVGILVGLGSAVYKAQTGTTVKKTVNGVTTTEVVRYDTWKQKVAAITDEGNHMAGEMFDMVGFQYTTDEGKTRDGAVGIAIGYIGLIAFWLGLMKLAEAAGLVAALSRLISPLFRLIFPSIPKDHPASGAILLNFSANMLGLDNAATPLGIKAMQELQTLNGKKDTATHAMCMFLALNVSSLTIIPASIIALRASQGSAAPAQFWPVMLVSTFIGTSTALVLCKIMERITPDNPRSGDPGADAPAPIKPVPGPGEPVKAGGPAMPTTLPGTSAEVKP